MTTFLAFVIVLILLFWVASISNRLTALEKKFKGLPSGSAPQPVPVPPAQTQAVPALPLQHPEVMPLAQLQPFDRAVEKPAEESVLAGGWLTKIGVLAIILGVGFFIKYAIDLGWINQWTRVLLGMAGGILLCVLGGLWKEKYQKYAAALTGGGIALMYFSIFSAYQFYNLVPQAVALVFMVAVSAAGVWLAYDRKSLSLASLAVLGAYLSPVVLHSGVDQHTGLFIYLGLINVAAVAVAFGYYWNELLFLSFLGSVFDFVLWSANYLNNGNTMAATAFVAFTFLVLIVGGAVALRKHQSAKSLPEKADYYFGVLAVLLGIFYCLSLYFLLYHNFHYYLAIFGLIGSIGAFFAYAIVDRLELSKSNYPLAFVGAGLLALACIWQFTGKTTDFMLLAFGLLLVVCGVWLKRAELRVWGLLTLVALVFAILFTPYDTINYVFIYNSKFGLTLAETFALWVTGWLYTKIEPTEQEKQASEAAHAIGSLVLWFGFSWEIVQYFQTAGSVNTRNLLLSLWWIGYGTALLLFGGAAKSAIYKKIALVIYILAILKVFLYDVLNLETGYRIVSFIVLGIILLSVSYSYQKNKEKVAQFLQEKDKV